MNWRWFYGRDLRQLTDDELCNAFSWAVERMRECTPVSRYAMLAWRSLQAEWTRRNFPPDIQR